jgi:hypothetical protein
MGSGISPNVTAHEKLNKLVQEEPEQKWSRPQVYRERPGYALGFISS